MLLPKARNRQKLHAQCPRLPTQRSQTGIASSARDVLQSGRDIVTTCLQKTANFVSGVDRLESEDLYDRDTRVRTFYWGVNDDIVVVFGHSLSISIAGLLAGPVITTLFGAIHCIAWSFRFRTHHEQPIWRLSSVVITCSAAQSALPVLAAMALDKLPRRLHKLVEFLLNFSGVTRCASIRYRSKCTIGHCFPGIEGLTARGVRNGALDHFHPHI